MFVRNLNEGYLSFFYNCAEFPTLPIKAALSTGLILPIALTFTGILPVCTIIAFAVAALGAFVGAVSMLVTYPLAAALDSCLGYDM
ncbi:MAG: hypothetical protein P1U39_07535 [Legionellaceae bacterium]|nr:hypothetical protein [Legionellaceae bacterium]